MQFLIEKRLMNNRPTVHNVSRYMIYSCFSRIGLKHAGQFTILHACVTVHGLHTVSKVLIGMLITCNLWDFCNTVWRTVYNVYWAIRSSHYQISVRIPEEQIEQILPMRACNVTFMFSMSSMIYISLTYGDISDMCLKRYYLTDFFTQPKIHVC